jgi:hypothetical protein
MTRSGVFARTLGAAYLALIVGAGQASARMGLSTDETIIRRQVQPGGVIQGSFTLSNTGDQPVGVELYLEDWHYAETGDGTVMFSQAGTTERSAAPWISFVPPRAELPPGGHINVDYTVRVPNDSTLQGGYYAMLFVETVFASTVPAITGGPESITASVDYTGRLGHTFMVEIQNTLTPRASLRNLTVVPPGVGPMVVRGTLANEGNVVAKCERASFHAQTADGLIAARGSLPGAFVDAGQQVPIQAEWTGSLSPGAYSLILTYDCGDELLVSEEVPLQVQ